MAVPPSLEAAVADAIAACAAAWPGVRVDPDALAAHVCRVVPPDQDPAAALARLRAVDLGLASACLAGDPPALRAVDDLLRAEATRAVAELRQPGWLAEEVQQSLRHRLLLPDGDTPPRLASYEGQGALSRWLGVAATRTALNLLRDRRRETDLDEARVAELPAPDADPGLELLRRRHRGEFEAAIRDAFAALDSPRDRNLLRLYYFDRVGLEQLGRMYKVHPSTVSRWLAAIREQVFEETQRLLAERVGFASGELDSMMRLLRSDLDITLSQILGPVE
jgi:RNA polymerase sigma-70 factor, ECF subfamily